MGVADLNRKKDAHEKGLEAAFDKLHDCGMSTDVSEVIMAYLSATGSVIVPIAPTEDMEGDGIDALDAVSPNSPLVEAVHDCWRAMILASPSPFNPTQLLLKPT